MRRLKPVSHDDRLSVVSHLDELRTRLIVSLLAVAVAFGFCFWQNHRLLELVDTPLAHQTQAQVQAGHGPLGATYLVQRSARDVAVQLRTVVGVLRSDHRIRPSAEIALQHAGASIDHDVSKLSAPPTGDRPITLGLGEPFTTTVTVTLIFALIISLPVILLQVYGFLMPAMDPERRRQMRPVMLAIPGLFVAGVAFGYGLVLPAAVHFFQNFNSGQFNVLVQASQYYKFAATTLLAMGLLFQVPVLVLALTRSGVLTPAQLRHNRRYAIVACASVAALLPSDVITMVLEAVPLYVLFELSVFVASVSERRARRAADAADAAGAPA